LPEAHIIVSITMQTIGAVCYPSSWNSLPANIDSKPERAWDWSDTELRRCLREGRQPWSSFLDPLW
jgi:hypothetical protein